MRHWETLERSERLHKLRRSNSATVSAEYAALLGILALSLLVAAGTFGRGTDRAFAKVVSSVTDQVSEVSSFGPNVSSVSTRFQPLSDPQN